MAALWDLKSVLEQKWFWRKLKYESSTEGRFTFHDWSHLFFEFVTRFICDCANFSAARPSASPLLRSKHLPTASSACHPKSAPSSPAVKRRPLNCRCGRDNSLRKVASCNFLILFVIHISEVPRSWLKCAHFSAVAQANLDCCRTLQSPVDSSAGRY